MDAIDFVIAWVDGSDENWRKEKNRYLKKVDEGNYDARYRDCGNLHYWFRSVEKYAPWVHTIHFVTWGHLPTWLNIHHPKLNIVKHEEYIPSEYLPTFSSHTIELNLHRIDNLSDHFVYFNDDTFLNNNVKEEDFFVGGLPLDTAALNVHCYALSRPIQMIAIRDTGVINEHFSFKKSINRDRNKWFNIKNGKLLLRTLALIRSPRFPGFYISHTPQSLLKEILNEVWEAEPQVLHETCMHKFREMTDVNQWVFKEWQLAKGQFIPRKADFSRAYFLGNDKNREIALLAAEDITKKKSKMICINDEEMSSDDYQYCTTVINRAFAQAYPDKSSFEI